jgi:uncharacterized protein (TIGR03435 family)
MKNRGLPEKLELVGIGGCLLLAIFSPSFVRAQSSATEDWEKSAGGKMSFDVASVKEDPPFPVFAPGQNIPPSERIHSNFPLDSTDKYTPGGLLSTQNNFVRILIGFAYKLTNSENMSVVNLPNWTRNARFEIEARGPAAATKDQMRLMMQSLLADRFNLAMHWEDRSVPVFAMVLVKPGKLGPQLWVHSDDPPCAMTSSAERTPRGLPVTCGTDGVRGLPNCENQLAWRDVTMNDVADGIRSSIGDTERPVIDRTGLDGKYDFTLTWMPQFPPGMGSNCDTSSEPNLQVALQQQLGIKLESSTGVQHFLVIDHIEEPTPN